MMLATLAIEVTIGFEKREAQTLLLDSVAVNF